MQLQHCAYSSPPKSQLVENRLLRRCHGGRVNGGGGSGLRGRGLGRHWGRGGCLQDYFVLGKDLQVPGSNPYRLGATTEGHNDTHGTSHRIVHVHDRPHEAVHLSLLEAHKLHSLALILCPNSTGVGRCSCLLPILLLLVHLLVLLLLAWRRVRRCRIHATGRAGDTRAAGHPSWLALGFSLGPASRRHKLLFRRRWVLQEQLHEVAVA
mmetsp:Transcript_31171/g.90624  ORF Transcript_31171/g.90624 Transcript_31171/m.90624 type:complete len:209 (-) Transcript_31171:357-983(-)